MILMTLEIEQRSGAGVGINVLTDRIDERATGLERAARTILCNAINQYVRANCAPDFDCRAPKFDNLRSVVEGA